MGHYETLGVDKNASPNDIKKAFRKLAMKEHPDKGGDVEKFKKINEAYETLSDENKRREYDNPPPPGFSNFGEHAFNPFEVFGNIFNDQMNQTRKLPDHKHTINFSMEDAFRGKNINLNITLGILCDSCVKKCQRCNGTGKCAMQHPMMMGMVMQSPCNECNTTGSRRTGCSKCTNGTIPTVRKVTMNVKPGVRSGHNEVFEGFGEQKKNDKDIPGNLIIEIQVENHPEFTREGDDLIITRKISFTESIIGSYVNIPHFSGDFIFDTRPHTIIDPRKFYEVQGKGMTDKAKLKIQFDISYPKLQLVQALREQIKNIFSI